MAYSVWIVYRSTSFSLSSLSALTLTVSCSLFGFQSSIYIAQIFSLYFLLLSSLDWIIVSDAFFPPKKKKSLSDMDLFAANVKNAAAAAAPPSPFSLKHSFPDRPISCSLAMTSRKFSSSYPFGAELLSLLEIRVFKPKLSSPGFIVRATAKKNHDNSPSPGTFFFFPPMFFTS